MAKRKKKAVVPESGEEALVQGFTAADCPYAEDDPEFERWNAEFDAAADKATIEYEKAKATSKLPKGAVLDDDLDEEGDAEDETKEDRSVVKEEYRARYAEMGHPAHCGDELAVLLNNLCLTKKGIEMARFEHICEANGVDLSKYNRTTKGWQGRLRMTGRNVLARKAFEADGVVKTTVERKDAEGTVTERLELEGAEAEYRLSAEWMASRRTEKAAA